MKYVLFVDDIFTADKKWLKHFLIEYKKHIGSPFCCFAHVRFLDEEVIMQLKEAGCHTAWLGIQSGDERLRKQIMNRPESNREIVDKCKLIKDAGIQLIVDHIFGIPTENAGSQDISYNLYTEINPDIINCYELVYFPKAKIIDIAVRTGAIMPSEIQKINEGKSITYQQGNQPSKFYKEYAKGFAAIPLGGIAYEILPLWIIKLLVYLKSGRGFIPLAMLQNEIFFTVRAIWKKLKPF